MLRISRDVKPDLVKGRLIFLRFDRLRFIPHAIVGPEFSALSRIKIVPNLMNLLSQRFALFW